MTAKLQSVLDRYDKLNELIADPSVIADINNYKKYTKELSDKFTTDVIKHCDEVIAKCDAIDKKAKAKKTAKRSTKRKG